MKKFSFIILATTFMFACNSQKSAENKPINYPVAEKATNFHLYFGDTIAEPYSWLENDTSAQTEAWVKAENEVTENYLAQIPFREKLRKRLTKLVDYEKFGTPFVKNGKYYFFKNSGLQNQSVLYVKNTLDGEAETVLDPNTFSIDGTVSLKSVDFSQDGRYISYAISRSGSDWEEIYAMDLQSKKLLPDKIEWAKFSSVAWRGNGFYYSAYDAPTAKGGEFSNVNENHKIYYHKIGTEQKDDELFYSNKKFPKRFYHSFVPEEENAIFIYESGANNGNKLFISANLSFDSKKMPIQEIASDDNFEYNVVEMINDCFYVLTNYKAPKYRLMKGDIKTPNIENWVDIIPEKKDEVLVDVQFVKETTVIDKSGTYKPIIFENIIAIYDKDASNKAYIYLRSDEMGEIKMPTYGSVSFSANKNSREVFFSFSSFTFPNTIYKLYVGIDGTEVPQVYIEPKVADFNPENYVTEQHFYASKDGTKVPLYLVYKKGAIRKGAINHAPALLYGYGGFNITYRPSFSPYRIPFLDNGGVYAIANIRGGGEYGEQWHIAGTKMQKQNVFDDFIAAGEYLISEGFTSKEKLACLGGSNGGLLVGAVVNQRPDLWRVAIPEVGVMDMLRYHKFTIGWNWASDYGTSEDSKEMYEYLKAYSPLHNIKNDNTPYPAILVTTADHDDRVVPAHSFKYAAQLQANNTGDAPKLIRIDTKAGHGGGKPIAKVIDEWSDVWSFVMWELDVKYK
ncbi:MAG: prolyl oligopeptidase family serine peptidase [Prevotellaceae bacterium]|jgi:prolyl oligopeptidase|nr:prolyl oligopeptidase family serine peptidase [Prevotellaceae bacterium]